MLKSSISSQKSAKSLNGKSGGTLDYVGKRKLFLIISHKMN